MTRKENLKHAIEVLSSVNKRSISRDCGLVYNYSVDEERLRIIINSGILFKPESDAINYLYVALDAGELIIQF